MMGLCKALEAFRPYLIMNHFTILTDNTALATRSLKNHTLNVRRLARINYVLSQFTFDIQHVKGTQNLLADHLSRADYKETFNTVQSICNSDTENKNSETEIANEDFIDEKNKDRQLRALRGLLLQNKKLLTEYTPTEKTRLTRQSRPFILNPEGILRYKKFNKGQRLQLIAIPQSLKTKILRLAHERLVSGNRTGRNRTYLKLHNKAQTKIHERRPNRGKKIKPQIPPHISRTTI